VRKLERDAEADLLSILTQPATQVTSTARGGAASPSILIHIPWSLERDVSPTGQNTTPPNRTQNPLISNAPFKAMNARKGRSGNHRRRRLDFAPDDDAAYHAVDSSTDESACRCSTCDPWEQEGAELGLLSLSPPPEHLIKRINSNVAAAYSPSHYEAAENDRSASNRLRASEAGPGRRHHQNNHGMNGEATVTRRRKRFRIRSYSYPKTRFDGCDDINGFLVPSS